MEMHAFSLQYLESLDPIWISLGPLLGVNIAGFLTLLFFWITYDRRTKESDVDLKKHSPFLSRFLKEYWYWVTSPFVGLMVKFHITPNVITFIGFIFSCISGYFFHKGMLGMGGWMMILGATFDMFDGQIARLTGRTSKSGAYLDSVMDRFCEGVVFIGLASYYRSTWVLPFVILALVGSMMVSYTKARGEGVGVDVKTGIMQRPERIVYLGVGSILSPIVAFLLSSMVKIPLNFMTTGAIVAISILTNYSALYRMFYVIRHLDPAKRSLLQRYFGS